VDQGHGHHEEITWGRRRARAWVPDPLGDAPPPESLSTARATSRALALMEAMENSFPPGWEPLARLLLRAEGIASSSIEGLNADPALVLLADHQVGSGDAAWIADNLAVAERALDDDLSIETLHRWHRRLMAHGPLPAELVGSFRRAPGWIGGSSPLDAAYVPPPPELVPDLVADLIGFCHRRDLDPVTQAALAHGQFETIHPYGDGNGRLGRILISWILRHWGVVLRTPPPVSLTIARDPGGYLSGLHLFRHGPRQRWITWFAETLAAATTIEGELALAVSRWRDHALESVRALRSDASARRLIDVLPSHPVINASTAAHAIGVTPRAARNALATLHRLGIVEPLTSPTTARGRPSQWWKTPGLVDLLSGRLPNHPPSP